MNDILNFSEYRAVNEYGAVHMDTYFLNKHNNLATVGTILREDALEEIQKHYKLIIYNDDDNESMNRIFFANEVGTVVIGANLVSGKLSGKNLFLNKFDSKNQIYVRIYSTIEHRGAIFKIRDELEEKYKIDDTKATLNLIVHDGRTLRTRNFEIDDVMDASFADHYNDDIINFRDKYIKTLNETRKGICILHGAPGTGKTTFVKHCLKDIDRKVLFLPPNMVDTLTSPELIEFLLYHKNSILFIEDAKHLLTTRNSGVTNESVANIDSMTDGMLSDILKITLVITSNVPIRDLDSSVTRPGRCILKHKFDNLNRVKAKQLCEKINTTFLNRSMTLAEIYNPANYSIRQNKVGF